MPKFLSARVIFGVVGCGCFVLLAYVWYVQYGPAKQQPCPLCILQRYAYALIGAVCLAAWIQGPARTGARLYAAIAGTMAASGAALAVWHVSKGHTMATCNADPIGDFVRSLPPAEWWPEFFFPSGGCADAYPPVFGLVVPVWSLIGLALITLIMLLSMFLPHRRKQN
jgi:disulfide bond formation protein DsbB